MPAFARPAVALSLTLAVAACARSRTRPGEGTTSSPPAPSSMAPPLDLAPAPAPPPPGSVAAGEAAPAAPLASAAPPGAPSCPRGMLRIPGGLPPRGTSPVEPRPVGVFCIDRWEAQLVDKLTGIPLSPYYPPERRLAVQIAASWEKQRLEMGSDEAREVPLPPLPEWQRQRDFEPKAVSRAGVIPSGYVSGINAEKACRNAGKRLCRHDEWLVACEGERRQRYPYGAEYKQGACNVFRALHPASELHGDPSIGHLDPRLNLVKEHGDPLLRRTGATAACKSAWGDDGAWDMNGNLDEWVEDDKGRFDGGFFSRSKREGCEQSVTAHRKDYFDYSTGVRCCADEGGGGAEGGGRD